MFPFFPFLFPLSFFLISFSFSLVLSICSHFSLFLFYFLSSFYLLLLLSILHHLSLLSSFPVFLILFFLSIFSFSYFFVSPFSLLPRLLFLHSISFGCLHVSNDIHFFPFLFIFIRLKLILGSIWSSFQND